MATFSSGNLNTIHTFSKWLSKKKKHNSEKTLYVTCGGKKINEKPSTNLASKLLWLHAFSAEHILIFHY